jgi:hypothetical protein
MFLHDPDSKVPLLFYRRGALRDLGATRVARSALSRLHADRRFKGGHYLNRFRAALSAPSTGSRPSTRIFTGVPR